MPRVGPDRASICWYVDDVATERDARTKRKTSEAENYNGGYEE